MNKLIGVAIWGYSSHVKRRYLPAIKKNKRLNLVGILSRKRSNVSDIDISSKITIWEDSKQMLDSPLVDIVIIATPIGLHASQCIETIKAGKHVLCEKPLTCNLEDTKKILEMANNNALIVGEGFMYLYHPMFNAVRKFVNSVSAKSSMSCNIKFGIPKLEQPGFRNYQDLCGGAFWDVGSYIFSAIIELFGLLNLKIDSFSLIKEPKAEVDNAGIAILSNESKNLRIYAEWSINSSYRNEIDIWTDQGSIFADRFFSKPENYDAEISYCDIFGSKRTFILGKDEQFSLMLDNFLTMLTDDEKSLNEQRRIIQTAQLMNDVLNVK